MDRAAIRTLLENAYAARVKRDLDGVMAAFHPGCRFELSVSGENADFGAACSGRDAVRNQIGALIEAFDFEDFTITDLIVDGERAVLRWQALVTARANGQQDRFTVVDVMSFADGKIESFEQFTDSAKVARLAAA